MKLFRPRNVTVEAMKVATGPGSEVFPVEWGVRNFIPDPSLLVVEVFFKDGREPFVVRIGDWMYRNTMLNTFGTMKDAEFSQLFEPVEMN